jgi:hypothetical protein
VKNEPRRGNLWVVLVERLQEPIPALFLLPGALQLVIQNARLVMHKRM